MNDIELTGNYFTDEFSYVKVSLKTCKKNCDEDKIDEFVWSNPTVNFFYNDSYIDFDENPY